jgi:triacylglycerol lipase
MADKIASLTTIGTPHHGSKTMDRICRLPKGLFKIGAVFINGWFRLLGDKHPNFYKVCRQFTTEYAKQFNERNPDMPGVYYQSYGAVMKHSSSDWLLSVPHFVIKRIEGDSDGMVTPASATWTNFRGVIKGSTRRGISHADEVDLRRRRFSKKTKTGHYHDICDFYLQMVKELKQSGF